jgi:putative membrane protein
VKSDDDAGISLFRFGTGLPRGFGMSDLPQTDVAPAAGLPLADPIENRFAVRVTADSHFAWLRTRLAVERTLMSWMRTAVSLIGFGFAIVQFFTRMQEMPGVNPARFPDAPRYLGLALICCGILGLVISIWQYWWTLRYLWGGGFTPLAGMTKEGMQTPSVAIVVILVLIGLFAFLAVLLRMV